MLEKTLAYTRRAALAAAGIIAAACSASAAEAEDGVFAHGVASGDPLSDRVVIWTRVTPHLDNGSPEVTWLVATDPDMRQIVRRGTVHARASRDYCIKIDVTGLSAGRTYYYAFNFGTQTSPIGRTKTAPTPSQKTKNKSLRIALVSCSNFPAGWFNVYQAIARRGDVDLVLHVGDYIYEYGPGEYATDWGKTVGRVPDPPHECKTLDDYRRRHAQYRSDPDLQAAHACAPWLVTWDDHETSNDAYKDGAQNHAPATEGPWSARKAAALQAYYEWLPLRDPEPGKAFEAINRSFDWGSLASITMLETRLLARARPLDYATDIDIITIPDGAGGTRKVPDLAGFKTKKLNAPDREMLGQSQMDWLAQTLKRSTEKGQRWQVLGNQVIMAKVDSPDLSKGLPAPVREAIGKARPEARAFFELSQFDVPFNLDAWDGYPVARERLFEAAQQAGARLVVCTGDTHAGWANTLRDKASRVCGVEFGATSVTSPSIADSFADFGLDGTLLNQLMVTRNPDVHWHEETKRGFTLITLTPDQARADFMEVDTIHSKTFLVSAGASWKAEFGDEPAALTPA